MDFEALQKEARTIAREKSWRPNGRSFTNFIKAVHETLSEAGKTYRKHGLDSGIVAPQASVTPYGIMAGGQLIPDGATVYLGDVPRPKPFGVPSELASVIIQMADMAQFYGVRNVEAHSRSSHGQRLGSPPHIRTTGGSIIELRAGYRHSALGNGSDLRGSPAISELLPESFGLARKAGMVAPIHPGDSRTPRHRPGRGRCRQDRIPAPVTDTIPRPARRRTANSHQNPGDETPGFFHAREKPAREKRN